MPDLASKTALLSALPYLVSEAGLIRNMLWLTEVNSKVYYILILCKHRGNHGL